MKAIRVFLSLGLSSACLFSACSKKEPVLSREDMFRMAPDEGSDKLEIVLAASINDSIPCSDYGDGCLSAHRVRTRKLEFIAVEFTDGEMARAGAAHVHGWTRHNWLFDDVEGEPELERWVVKYYDAKRFKEKGAGSPGMPSGSAPTSPAN